MTASLMILALSSLFATPEAPVRVGGWATVTVETLPDQIMAGRAIQLVFVVKQHGKNPLAGLKPVVEFNAGGPVTRVAATPGKTKGQYTASVTFPKAGSWNVTIHSGFGESKLTLNPLTVVSIALH